MPMYDVEIIHRIKYKKRIRATDENEAHDKAAAIWMDRITEPADEDVETSITPVREPRKKRKNVDYRKSQEE